MALPNNNDVIYGTDLVLMVNVGTEQAPLWQQFAHAQSHSIDITRESRQVSSKSTGEWMLSRYGKISWSGSIEGLIIYDANVFNYEQLADMQIGRDLIKVISVLNDAEQGTPLDDAKADYDPTEALLANAAQNPFTVGTPYYEGDAIISSLGKTAGQDDNATFSLSFEGASALEKKTVADPVGV
jgi:predicted secreted protein